MDPNRQFKVLVGSEAKEFILSRDAFAAKSPYFDRALNGEFSERNGVIRMPVTDIDTFSLFVSYVYSLSRSIQILQKPSETDPDRLDRIIRFAEFIQEMLVED